MKVSFLYKKYFSVTQIFLFTRCEVQYVALGPRGPWSAASPKMIKYLVTKIYMCKKAGFLHEYIFVKKQYFYNCVICKKSAVYIKMTLFYKDRFYATYIYIYIPEL